MCRTGASCSDRLQKKKKNLHAAKPYLSVDRLTVSRIIMDVPLDKQVAGGRWRHEWVSEWVLINAIHKINIFKTFGLWRKHIHIVMVIAFWMTPTRRASTCVERGVDEINVFPQPVLPLNSTKIFKQNPKYPNSSWILSNKSVDL